MVACFRDGKRKKSFHTNFPSYIICARVKGFTFKPPSFFGWLMTPTEVSSSVWSRRAQEADCQLDHRISHLRLGRGVNLSPILESEIPLRTPTLVSVCRGWRCDLPWLWERLPGYLVCGRHLLCFSACAFRPGERSNRPFERNLYDRRRNCDQLRAIGVAAIVRGKEKAWLRNFGTREVRTRTTLG